MMMNDESENEIDHAVALSCSKSYLSCFWMQKSLP